MCQTWCGVPLLWAGVRGLLHPHADKSKLTLMKTPASDLSAFDTRQLMPVAAVLLDDMHWLTQMPC